MLQCNTVLIQCYNVTGSVSVRTKEELTVFVRAFGGDPTPAQYQAEFQSLAKAVKDAGGRVTYAVT